jgi:hypothetical protein
VPGPTGTMDGVSTYSTLFYRGPITTDGLDFFTVPPATTAVLRDVTAYAQGDGPDWAILVSDGGDGTRLWTPIVTTGGSWDVQRWKGRAVWNAGDVMGFYPTNGEWWLWASGYLLGA